MDYKKVEAKWQKYWAEHPELYRANNDSNKPKKYVLVEFPYPSGSGLHVGHAFSFTGSDVYARLKRMQGNEVLFPMGWDAFGLPTENYAIKMKRKPQEVTKENTEMFKRQMKQLAFSFDWEREINTTDPNYYKWTQWIFIQLFKKGLAYKKEMPINWCPSCKIGLANEEVVNGTCERCGTEVERRTISQWIVKITDYADRLIDGLKETTFIEKVKQVQINWIGKSEGARIKFQISNFKFQNKNQENFLEVFTTRPDTIYGTTFMVVAPEHLIVSDIILRYSRLQASPSDDSVPKITSETINEIKNYVKQARGKSDMERTELSKDKTGVFSGLYAINPATGKEIPVWISDFVLASYGTGAIMAVPAHDERDKAFAKKFGLPIIEVIDENGIMINSGNWNGLHKEKTIKKAIEWIKEKGIGEGKANYHLRDWIFSRQHYWGEPIPMINCPDHGWVPVPEDQLPVVLPPVEQYEPTDDGQSPLSKIESFVKTTCPVCGKVAIRETDTMPNWAGSDWYFLRYIDPVNDTVIASQELQKKWLPVDVYVGGDEHNTLHLLYSRFIYQFLYDLGAVPKEHPEPYQKRLSHGVILGMDGNRMSKTKGNVIVPEVVAEKYGVDVVRMYLMFMGPFDGTMAWNENTLMGVKRFLDKLEKQIGSQLENKQDKIETASNKEVLVLINKLIKGVGEDLEGFKFNTAIAKMMEALNKLSISNYKLRIEDMKTLVKLVAPIAPYLAEELWSKLGETISVHSSQWPEYEAKYIVDEVVSVVVAINGKMRDQLQVNQEIMADKDKIVEMAKNSEKMKVWLDGKEIVREIYIPGKMVNFVI